MVKPPRLEHVKYVRSNGRIYAYFNTGQKENGKVIYQRLPDPASAQFFASYGQLKASRARREAPQYTVRVLLSEYLASAKFEDKAKSTQALYRIQLKKAAALLGDYPAHSITPGAVRIIMEGEGMPMPSRNAFISAIGAAYTWARRAGKTECEPVKDIEREKGGSHDPWPEDILDKALESDDALVRLAVHLLYFTGQRIGDVCKLRWGDIRDGVVHVLPQKTRRHKRLSAPLEIPLSSELAAILDATAPQGITILTDGEGRPLQPQALRRRLQAFTEGLGVKTVPHGLRKNAVNVMLENGCSVAEVAAITGQTYDVVEHYAAKVNRRKLGQAAMLKFEAGRRTNKP